MKCLLDVNFLLAGGWSSHPQHVAVNRWLASASHFSTCSVTEMGFLRVSVSAGFGAAFEDARQALVALIALPTHAFVPDQTRGADLPKLNGGRHVTDAHLMLLARTNRMKLVTLDEELCRQPWATGVAVNPVARHRRPS